MVSLKNFIHGFKTWNQVLQHTNPITTGKILFNSFQLNGVENLKISSTELNVAISALRLKILLQGCGGF